MTLLHFSEDPTIERFEPHVPETNPDQQPAVWAIDEAHSPLYWFPRDCPRGTVWSRSPGEQRLLMDLFGTAATRLHVTELRWLESMRTTELFVYLLPADTFEPWAEAEGQWISRTAVVPLSVDPVGDLLARHVEAKIELRFATEIWSFWDRVPGSGLPFSGVRLRNSRQLGRSS